RGGPGPGGLCAALLSTGDPRLAWPVVGLRADSQGPRAEPGPRAGAAAAGQGAAATRGLGATGFGPCRAAHGRLVAAAGASQESRQEDAAAAGAGSPCCRPLAQGQPGEAPCRG